MIHREGIFVVMCSVSLLLICGILWSVPALAVTVGVPEELEGIKGSTVLVPVTIDTPVSLQAYMLYVMYDPNVLYYLGYVRTAYLDKDLPPGGEAEDDFFVVEKDPNGGRVNIGVLNFYPVAVEGILFALKFKVLSAADKSPILLSTENRPDNDLAGIQMRAGWIRTSKDPPADKCSIEAIILATSKPVDEHRIILSLTGSTTGGTRVSSGFFWEEGVDANVVSFVADPGAYRLAATIVGYAPYYSEQLDCNVNDVKQTSVIINTSLMPSYTVNRQDIAVDPNNPRVKFTFTFITASGNEDDWSMGNYPLTIRFFDSSNDSSPKDGWPDTTDPNGPSGSLQFISNLNGFDRYVCTVDLGDANFRMTGLPDSYVIAFRTGRGTPWNLIFGEEFLDPNEARVHRYVIKAQLTEATKVAAAGSATMNLKKELSSKGSMEIHMDTNSVSNAAIYNIIKSRVTPGTESVKLEFDATLADHSLFSPASDANVAMDPNKDLVAEVSYYTGVGAGLTATDPGVEDPNDIIVVSIKFTDPNGDEIRYNQGWNKEVPLIFFDMPAPRALQDPNITNYDYAAIKNRILTTSAQTATPTTDPYYGIYYIHGGSSVPELFVPDVDGGSLSIFEQNGVIMFNIGVPHVSDWYIGERLFHRGCHEVVIDIIYTKGRM